MNFVDIIILSFVEGVTEFLPISSTAHLIFTAHFLNLAERALKESFIIAIQLGTILSALVIYAKTLAYDFSLIKKTVLAFLPTGILGLAFYPVIKNFLSNEMLSAVMILVGGGALLLFEYWHKNRPEKVFDLSAVSYKQAMVIGFFQAIALIPGVSRSAATIVGGLWLGLTRKTTIEFSFLLAIPTMLAATVFEVGTNINLLSGQDINSIILGFVVSFVVGLVAIKTLVAYTEKYTFTPFGWYRIVLGIILIALLL